jgi:hypothetical protein
VNSLANPVGDVLTTIMTIENVTKEVLSEGLPCNKEHEIKEPSPKGYIFVPPDTLKVIVNDREIAQRGNKLYKDGSFLFTEPVEMTRFIEIPFDDLPVIVQQYITLKAARWLLKTLDGDTEKYQLTTEEWYRALADFKRYKQESWAPNMLYDNYTNTRVIDRRRYYNGY